MDGAANALKMFSNETALNVPEIMDLPRKHKLLSYLVGVQLDTSKTENIWSDSKSEKAIISPYVNHWIAQQLPKPNLICFTIQRKNGKKDKIRISDLPIEPIDFIALFKDTNPFSEKSDLSKIINDYHKDEMAMILYQDKTSFSKTQVSIYEITPLIQLLNELLASASPMLPNDLKRATQIDRMTTNKESKIDNGRLIEAFKMQIAREGLDDAIDTIEKITDLEDQWEALEKLTKRIFGEDFLVVPEFTIENAEEFTAAYEFQDLLKATNEYAVEEWTQGLAQVKPALKVRQQIQQIQSILNLPVANQATKIIQLPFQEDAENYRWLGVTYPETIRIEGDVKSLALELPNNFKPTQTCAGFIIEEWQEALPEKEITTGIAMNYDQANTEPPQTMLLCVAPNATGNWQWEDLITTITDTMNMAKKRAVDPYLLSFDEEGKETVLHQVLPALVAPICYSGNTPWVDFGAKTTKA